MMTFLQFIGILNLTLTTRRGSAGEDEWDNYFYKEYKQPELTVWTMDAERAAF